MVPNETLAEARTILGHVTRDAVNVIVVPASMSLGTAGNSAI